MSPRPVFYLTAAVSCAILSCANEPPTLADDPAALNGSGGGASDAETLVDGIPNAENLVFTSTGRLLVTSDDGVFEILQNGDKYRSRPLHTGETCWFGGIVEIASTLYANCYDMNNTRSQIFAAQLTEAPDFRPIHDLPGYQLANGLATDGKDLFIAATVQGQLLRLRVSASNPFAIDKQEILEVDAGLFADGIKVIDHTVYWTNFTLIARATLDARGRGRTEIVTGALTFFDDIYLDGSGVWAADSIGGSVRRFDFRGRESGSTAAASFDGPSAIAPAEGRLGLPEGAMVVTERFGGRVSMFVP
jgi:hypothetical protein